MSKVVEAAGMLLMTRSAPQKFLLLEHSDRWDLPKGHVEQGENIINAALRETEEETGISSDQIELVEGFRFEITYEVKHSRRGLYLKRVSYYLGYVDRPFEVQLTEHQGYRWFDWPPDGPIQAQTIDPLLSSLAHFLSSKPS